MPAPISAYDQYLFAFIVLLGTYIAAFFLLFLSQRSKFSDGIKTYRGIAQNFLTVINVIFALNLAFLANDTWSAHDRALNVVLQEAGNLRGIIDLAEHLPAASRAEVERAARDYADLTVASEWPLLARRQSSETVSQALDRLVALLSSPEVASGLTASVHAQILQQAIHVRGLRDQRIALSQTHVNPLKWLGMVFLGFLTMISIAMVHVDQPRAQVLSVLLFATAAAPSAAIILVHGNPFQEPMAIRAAPIAAAAALNRPVPASPGG
jgi:hypothetical protein